LNYTHVLFNWAENDQAVAYQIEISISNTFTPSLVDAQLSTHYYMDKNNLDWDENYYWKVRSILEDESVGEWSSLSTFSIGENSETFTNDNDPIVVINHNPELTSNGVVFFGSYINQYSAAIDVDGNEVWNSGSPKSFVYFNHSPDGELLGGIYDNDFEYSTNIYGGAVDINVNTLFVESPFDDMIPNYEFLQHEIVKLPNGNYLTIGPDIRNYPIPTFNGHFSWEDDFTESELASFPWMGDRIIEWDASGDTLWSISTFDIYSHHDFDILGDILNQTASLNLTIFDWTHVNAIEYNETQDAIYISSRHLSKITKIDYSSKEVLWSMGYDQSGLANIDNSGNTYVHFTPNYDDGSLAAFSFQHGLQVLDNGNIITLDNGNLSRYIFGYLSPKTRAIEIGIDEVNYTAEIVWEYILPDSLYSRLSGNAQKLSNGNYFITVIADGATSLEISPSKEVVWKCKYNLENGDGLIYRAHKLLEVPIDCPVEINECGICGGGETDCQLSNNLNKPDRINILYTYPNPFNPSINIEYSNDTVENISIKIYNLKGEHIETLVNSHASVGQHKISWNASNHPSGIYFVRLLSGNNITIQKIILLR